MHPCVQGCHTHDDECRGTFQTVGAAFGMHHMVFHAGIHLFLRAMGSKINGQNEGPAKLALGWWPRRLQEVRKVQ